MQGLHKLLSSLNLLQLKSDSPLFAQLSGRLSAYGCEAPEHESGIYTLKSDVYSFGAVMLELLTGRKSYDRWIDQILSKLGLWLCTHFAGLIFTFLNNMCSKRNRGEKLLVRWAIHQLHDIDALSRMVDPSLNGEYPAKSLSRFADIISRCVQVSVLMVLFSICFIYLVTGGLTSGVLLDLE